MYINPNEIFYESYSGRITVTPKFSTIYVLSTGLLGTIN